LRVRVVLRVSTSLRAAARSDDVGPVNRVVAVFWAAAARRVPAFVVRAGRLAAGFLAGADRLAAGFFASRRAEDLVGRAGRSTVAFFFRDGAAGGVTCPAFLRRAAAALA
jgi:hypothetical protein